MAEFKETYPGAAFNADGKHIGPGPWLDVIRKANAIVHAETGGDGPFGAPHYADDDERGSVEIYDFATVSHDFPSPREPAYPSDPDKFGSIEWDRVSRERGRLHDEWVRDPRNTVTITALTDEGARLLTRAHDAVVNPFTVVGVVSYDPETDSLS